MPGNPLSRVLVLSTLWILPPAAAEHQGPAVERRERASTPRREARKDTPPERGAASGPLASALAKCAVCHGKVASLREDLRNADGLGNHLPWTNDGVLDVMVAKSGLSPEEAQAIRQVAKDARERALAGKTEGFAIPAHVDPCYVTKSEQKSKIELLSKNISSSSLLAIRLRKAIESESLIPYDRSTVPHTWQSEEIGTSKTPAHLMNEKAIIKPPSDRKYDYELNGGMQEFPWKRPAGTDLAPGVASHHFIIPAESGPIADAVKLSKETHPDHYGGTTGIAGPNLGWKFRKGTMFVEALSVADPITRKRRVIEYRLRMLDRFGIWRSDILRSFANPEDLERSLKELCSTSGPAECKEPSVAAFLKEIVPPKTTAVATADLLTKESLKTGMFGPLQLNRVAPKALLASAQVQKLPPLPPKVVSELLERTPFQSVMSRPWIAKPKGEGTSFAPVSDSEFHVVPKGAMMSHLKMSQNQCQVCHSNAGKHVRLFDPDAKEQMNAVEPKGNEGPTRTWYGMIAGGADSFWNPFDPAAARTMGNVFDPKSHWKCLGGSTGLLGTQAAAADSTRKTAPGAARSPHR